MTVTLDKYFKKSKTAEPKPGKKSESKRPTTASAAAVVLSVPEIFREISEFVNVVQLSRVSRNFRALVESCAEVTLTDEATRKFLEDAEFRKSRGTRKLRCGWIPFSAENLRKISQVDKFQFVKFSVSAEQISDFIASLSEGAGPWEGLDVRGLRLEKLELRDTSFLGKFPALKRLEFSKCGFVDHRGLNSCSLLEFLLFQANFSREEVPHRQGHVIGNLKSLRDLDLSHCSGVGYLKFLGPMPRLETLTANKCDLEVLDEISVQCPNLKKLDLVDSATHDFEPLEKLRKLEEIAIDREALYRFPDIPLKKLRVSDSLLHEWDLRKFDKMKYSLRWLELGGASFEKDERKLPAVIKSFVNLEYLDMSKVSCVGIGFLKNMPNLKTAKINSFLGSREMATLKKKGVQVIDTNPYLDDSC